MGRPEPHGQGSKAALIGAVKSAAVLQKAAVQVKADVGLETLRETLQNLQENQEGRTTSNIKHKSRNVSLLESIG